MTAPDTGLPVNFRVIGSIPPRDKILPCLVSRILQTSAYNLFDLAIMDIDTWPEFHIYIPLPACPGSSILNDFPQSDIPSGFFMQALLFYKIFLLLLCFMYNILIHHTYYSQSAMHWITHRLVEKLGNKMEEIKERPLKRAGGMIMKKSCFAAGVRKLLALGLVLAFVCTATACTNSAKNNNNGSDTMADNHTGGTTNGNGTASNGTQNGDTADTNGGTTTTGGGNSTNGTIPGSNGSTDGTATGGDNSTDASTAGSNGSADGTTVGSNLNGGTARRSSDRITGTGGARKGDNISLWDEAGDALHNAANDVADGISDLTNDLTGSRADGNIGSGSGAYGSNMGTASNGNSAGSTIGK